MKIKMKIKTLLLVVVVLSALTSSCSKKVYFNNQMRETLEVANIPLTGLQFYNDKKIVLKRKLKSGSTEVESGKVKLKKGEHIHFLILKKKTPGVLKNINGNELSIAFENGEGKQLFFEDSPNHGRKIDYQLNVEYNHKKKRATIIYDGKEYILHEHGRDARLMVKKDDLNKIKVKKSRMKGVRLK